MEKKQAKPAASPKPQTPTSTPKSNKTDKSPQHVSPPALHRGQSTPIGKQPNSKNVATSPLHRAQTLPIEIKPSPATPKQIDQPVPQLPANYEATLETGSNSSGGGEEGGHYQVLWLTLACLNGIFSPANGPKIQEIVLEGNDLPFDDVEILHTDTTLTLFQSKYRNREKPSQGEIGLLDLLADKGKKKVAEEGGSTNSNKDDFSLEKYFVGMEKAKAKYPGKEIRFIICTTVGFNKGSKKSKNLDIDTSREFWSEEGVLTALAATELDPLLRYSYMQDGKKTPLCTLDKQYYCRFADEFIELDENTEAADSDEDESEDSGSEEDESLAKKKEVKKVIFDKLRRCIENARENEEEWVSWEEIDDDDHIKDYLKHLQFWTNQPKNPALCKLIKAQLVEHIQFGANEIQEYLVRVFPQVRAAKKIMMAKDIQLYLKQARGAILTKHLGVISRQYHVRFVLSEIERLKLSSRLEFRIVYKHLCGFLSKSVHNIMLLTSTEADTLKFIVNNLIHTIYNDPKIMKASAKVIFGEDWFLAPPDIYPFFETDTTSKKVLDFAVDDLLRVETTRLIIIDRAHELLANGAREYLQRFMQSAKENKVRVILLVDQKAKNQLKALCGDVIEVEQEPWLLTAADMQQIFSSEVYEGQCLTIFDQHTIQLTAVGEQQTPALFNAICHPLAMVDAIQSAKSEHVPAQQKITEAQEVAPEQQLLCVTNPAAMSFELFMSVYSIEALCAAEQIHYLQYYGLDVNTENEALLNQITAEVNKATKCTWKMNAKHSRFYYNKASHTDGLPIYAVQPVTAKQLAQVVRYKDSVNQIPVPCSSFVLPKNKDEKPIELLWQQVQKSRVVLTADFGSGKSTVLEQMYQDWRSGKNNQFEWVFCLRLPEVITLIQDPLRRENYPLIIEHQAKLRKWITADFSLWQNRSITSAFKSATTLLLIDGWDVLKPEQIEIAYQWLQNLPKQIRFIVATRQHAEQPLLACVQSKIGLSALTLAEIVKFIQAFQFDRKDKSANVVKSRAAEFAKLILGWLDLENNTQAVEVLQRPLHLKLFCEALRSYYQKWKKAESTTLEKDSEDVPWSDKRLYRSKLYILIIQEQLRHYVADYVSARGAYAQSEQRQQLLTQSLLLRLREIAFMQTFNLKPTINFSALPQVKIIDQELYDLGLVVPNNLNKPEDGFSFVHRIFAETFTTEFILMGLLQDQNNDWHRQIFSILQSESDRRCHEQVWLLLGEMIRYGDPLLSLTDPESLQRLKKKVEDMLAEFDIIGSYTNFLHSCITGDEHQDLIPPSINYPLWFKANQELSESDDEAEQRSSQKSSSPIGNTDVSSEESLIQARSSKSNALTEARLFLQSKQLHNTWLLRLICLDSEKKKGKPMSKQELAAKINFDITKLDEYHLIAPADLLHIIHRAPWPEISWAGYWDLDVYLRLVRLQSTCIPSVLAAYFIHRIENRNGRYYTYGLDSALGAILSTLRPDKLDPQSAIYFLLMLQTILRQPQFISNIPKSNLRDFACAFIPEVLQLCWRQFQRTGRYPWLGINTIYQICAVFRIPIYYDEQTKHFILSIYHNGKELIKVSLSCPNQQQRKYVETCIAQAKLQTSYAERNLPAIQWVALEHDEAYLDELSLSQVPLFSQPAPILFKNTSKPAAVDQATTGKLGHNRSQSMS